MINPMKPASEVLKLEDLHKLQYPIVATIKLDGIGCRIIEGIPFSPQNKVLPNLLLNAWARKNRLVLNNLQGELIAAGTTQLFNASTRTFMNSVATIANSRFVVYDRVKAGAYIDRFLLNDLPILDQFPTIYKVGYKWCRNPRDVEMYLDHVLAEGHEGLVLRSPEGEYKYGRCTVAEGLSLKLKPFKDAEATVIECIPAMENQNEAVINELGRTSRSKNRAGLVPKEMLGALRLRAEDGREFKCGLGPMTHSEREEWWIHRKKKIGLRVTYTFLDYGEVDLPRSPKFKGVRLD